LRTVSKGAEKIAYCITIETLSKKLSGKLIRKKSAKEWGPTEVESLGDEPIGGWH
jgi:hypothetical protein